VSYFVCLQSRGQMCKLTPAGREPEMHKPCTIQTTVFVSFARASPPAYMFWMKISKNLPNMLSKMALAQRFCSICWGSQKPLHSLTPALDLAALLIGPGGLLLVGSDLLQSQFHLLWVGLGKQWISNLECEKFSCRVKCKYG